MRPIPSLKGNVERALVSFERVFEVLDLPPMIQEPPHAMAIPAGPARVAFDQVSFRYPTAPEVSLASLELIAESVAEPGELVALVGPPEPAKHAELIQRGGLYAELYERQVQHR